MVSIILKPLKLQIDCLMCSHTMHQLSGVWLHFYILWWIAKLRNSGNGKDIEYYQLERDCFVSFSCPWLDTSNQEGSILYLLCFLDQIVKLLIAKWNHHKTMFSSPSYILSMPKYTSMFIIWKKCRTHWFLSHFGKAVAVQPASILFQKYWSTVSWDQAKLQLTIKILLIENIYLLDLLEGLKETFHLGVFLPV